MSESYKQYLALLLDRLQQLDLFKVILFGSCAYGMPGQESDIDLLVVLNRDDYPETWREKSDLYLQVSRVVRDVRRQVPVDLIVHTRAMYEKFIEMDSLFAREIEQNGRILYDKNNRTPG